MKEPAANQRLYPRTLIHQQVTVVVEGREYSAYLRDLSDSGAFLYTTARPAGGMQVTMALPKSIDSNAPRVSAEVVRVVPLPYPEMRGVALKFSKRALAQGSA